jgi:YbbR domain-containing protein
VVNTDPDVEIQDAPSSVTADVDLLGATSVPVVVHTSRTQVGYQIVSARAEPSRVELIGPQRELGIAQAVVEVDFGNRTNTLVQDGVPVVVVDPRDNNRPLSDVTANPATVRVTVVIQTVDGSAVSTVVPQLTGAVAPGHMVSQVLIDPPTVTLTGTENILNGAQQTLTAPISLAGLTSDRTVTVPLQVPEGLKASVTAVTVHLVVVTLPEAVVTPTAPTPAASPSPSGSATRTTQSATSSCSTRSQIVGGPTPCPP